MIAIDFPQRNLMLAEDQPEYETLPVYCKMHPEFQVPWEMTACFQLNKDEIDEIVRTGKLWYTQCLFGNQFQPVRMTTQNPFEDVATG